MKLEKYSERWKYYVYTTSARYYAGVTTQAAMVGTYSKQVVIDDNNSIYVTDDTPNAEKRYRARFYSSCPTAPRCGRCGQL